MAFWQNGQLCYLCRIIHSDIKPDNLLMSLDKKSVKLSDFGCVSARSQSQRKVWVSWVWMGLAFIKFKNDRVNEGLSFDQNRICCHQKSSICGGLCVFEHSCRHEFPKIFVIVSIAVQHNCPWIQSPMACWKRTRKVYHEISCRTHTCGDLGQILKIGRLQFAAAPLSVTFRGSILLVFVGPSSEFLGAIDTQDEVQIKHIRRAYACRCLALHRCFWLSLWRKHEAGRLAVIACVYLNFPYCIYSAHSFLF